MLLFWGGVILAHDKPHVAHQKVLTLLHTKCTQSWQGAKLTFRVYNSLILCTWATVQVREPD